MHDRHAPANEIVELTDAQLDAVTGGEVRAEARIFQALASAISEVTKNFGGTLQTVARGG